MTKLRIKYTDQIIPNAYHGTSCDNAKSICKNGFHASHGERQFLGDGVYFFENSQKNAQEWSKKHYKGKPVAVIKAIISLGNCLDLNDWDHRNFVLSVQKKLTQRGYNSVTDAVVINFIAKNFPPVDAVRATYIQPGYGEIFPGSRFYNYSQLIICVRNKNNISSLYMVWQDLNG